MLLNIGITKLAFITQNNHVYEHTAENPTLKVSLNVRSPYRRQKRDSIIRLLFRQSYTGIEILAINIITFFPIISIISYFLTFLRCDHTDYFTFLTIISTISYLPTFLRSHRLFPIFLLSCVTIIPTILFSLRPYRLFLIFLPSCDHIDYFLPFCFLAAISTTYYRHTYRWPLEDNLYSLSQSEPR
jgi:hypothetical protein